MRTRQDATVCLCFCAAVGKGARSSKGSSLQKLELVHVEVVCPTIRQPKRQSHKLLNVIKV